jgi:hypothetical protein
MPYRALVLARPHSQRLSGQLVGCRHIAHVQHQHTPRPGMEAVGLDQEGDAVATGHAERRQQERNLLSCVAICRQLLQRPGGMVGDDHGVVGPVAAPEHFVDRPPHRDIGRDGKDDRHHAGRPSAAERMRSSVCSIPARRSVRRSLRRTVDRSQTSR